jgi:hypothetical protein
MSDRVWFYRFPEEMPMPILLGTECKSETEARAQVRIQLGLKRLPHGVLVWREPDDPSIEFQDTEIGRIVEELNCIEVPFKLEGKRELVLHIGYTTLSFDAQGNFVKLETLADGPQTHLITMKRGEKHGL